MTKFVKGSKATQQRMTPTTEKLITNMNKEYKAQKKGEDNAKMSRKAAKIAAARRWQGMVLGDLIKDIVEGGHGFVLLKKPDDTLRLVMENWNSLKMFTEKEHDRIHRIDAIRKKYNADVTAGQETQTFWPTVVEELGEKFHFNELLAVG